MLILFTDFGLDGPYVGQLHLAAARAAPGLAVLDLMHDAPAFDPQASAYLLAAVAAGLPPGAVLVGVVDPGVGSARRALIVELDGRFCVGPDNGLFEPLAARAARVRAWNITWRPEHLSASFHGRDLFVPVAARLATGTAPDALGEAIAFPSRGWPADLARVIYLDRYGNAMTGLRADTLPADARLRAGGRVLSRARTFADLPEGAAFWYANSQGLAEIALNRGSAAAALGLAVGTPVEIAA